MLEEEEGEDYPQCCKRLSDCFSELWRGNYPYFSSRSKSCQQGM